MDAETLAAYDRDPASFAADWASQPPPSEMYGQIRQYFRLGGQTADIGCGSGRDAAWLSANGYPTIGYDASEGLLNEARSRYPSLRFEQATLPSLDGLGTFDNVLCETVIMHLAPPQIAPSVRRLLELLNPAGTLYLSWRVTPDTNRRDEHGRLYAAFDPDLVMRELEDAQLLRVEEVVSESSGKVIWRLFARKT